jgi:putative flippase GtrA
MRIANCEKQFAFRNSLFAVSYSTFARFRRSYPSSNMRAMTSKPVLVQFIIYLFIGAASALTNLIVFLTLFHGGLSLTVSAVIAYIIAAAVNYRLCILILFRDRTSWGSTREFAVYAAVVATSCALDLTSTKLFWAIGMAPWLAKSLASFIGLFFNFTARKVFVFSCGSATSTSVFPPEGTPQ